MTIQTQQQVLHNQHVMNTHQLGLVYGQQLNNHAADRVSIFGPGFGVSHSPNDVARTLQSARNAPARPMQATLPQVAAREQGCFNALLESCCNIWGCTVETLD